jgi:CelD/BcsL family acetyltransferase involved in cellulose biosynthesis
MDALFSAVPTALHAGPPMQTAEAQVSASVVEVVVGLPAVESWAGALDELLAATQASPAAWWTTLDPWFRQHRECEPWTVMLSSGRRVVAAAVLWRRRRFGVWWIGRPGESGEPGCIAAMDESLARELADALVAALRGLGRPWRLHISNLPADCAVLEALRAALPLNRVDPGPSAALMRFKPAEPLGAYLSRNTRAAMAKARNRIQREGRRLQMQWTDEPGQIERCLPEVFRVHRERNLQLRGVAGIDDPQTAAAIGGMIRNHAQRGRALLLTVRIDSDLAAFAICFVAGATLWVYTNMAAPAWLRYSPGSIANAEIVARAHRDADIRILDWGAGLQRYKLSGATELRHLWHLSAWSARWMVRLAPPGRWLRLRLGQVRQAGRRTARAIGVTDRSGLANHSGGSPKTDILQETLCEKSMSGQGPSCHSYHE